MSKYYAVAKGRAPGIYRTWEETKRQVDGFSGAVHKSFKSDADARTFLDGYSKPTPASPGGATGRDKPHDMSPTTTTRDLLQAAMTASPVASSALPSSHGRFPTKLPTPADTTTPPEPTAGAGSKRCAEPLEAPPVGRRSRFSPLVDAAVAPPRRASRWGYADTQAPQRGIAATTEPDATRATSEHGDDSNQHARRVTERVERATSDLLTA